MAISHPRPLLSPSPFWEEGHSLFQRVARIRSDFAFWLSLHNFTWLVALTLVFWTFHSFLKKNTQQMKRQCPAWPLHFPALPRAPNQSWASCLPSWAAPLRAQQLLTIHPLGSGESLTGQRARLRLGPACFDSTDGEEGRRSGACLWKRCCRALLLNPGNFP